MKFFTKDTYAMVLTVCVGAFLGIILGRTIINSNNLHGPDSNKVKHQIFSYQGECYRFKPKPYVCSLFVPRGKK